MLDFNMADLLLNCLKLLGASVAIGITTVVILGIVTLLALLFKAVFELIFKN